MCSTRSALSLLLPLDAGEQYRFGFSMSACIGCHSCEVACAEQNGLPEGTVWRRVGEVEGGTYPDTRRLQLSMSRIAQLEQEGVLDLRRRAAIEFPNMAQHVHRVVEPSRLQQTA